MITDLLEVIKPVDLSKCTTYCFELSRLMPVSSEHFEMIDLHYTTEGLQVTYLCDKDNRKYTVSIEAEK